MRRIALFQAAVEAAPGHGQADETA